MIERKQVEVYSTRTSREYISERYGYEIGGEEAFGAGLMSLLLVLFELNKQSEDAIVELRQEVKVLTKNSTHIYNGEYL